MTTRSAFWSRAAGSTTRGIRSGFAPKSRRRPDTGNAARDLVARLVRLPGWSPWVLAVTSARLGDRDALLQSIERSFSEHAPIAEIYASPALDPFRHDPAVMALFQRAGLAQ